MKTFHYTPQVNFVHYFTEPGQHIERACFVTNKTGDPPYTKYGDHQPEPIVKCIM